MSVPVGYHWHLRRLMAERGLFATTELVPLLAQRGVRLSREQVYRLVTGIPERLSLATLAALCDILGATPGDLVEPYRKPSSARPASRLSARRAAGPVALAPDPAPPEVAAPAPLPRPRRARIAPRP
nr:helix-turn-helix transcriptional regulator [Pseudofrankia sp. DC12]